MSLKTIIDFIKSRTENQFKFKHHAKERLLQRNLNSETIFEYMRNQEIVGIHEQNNNVYKLWFEYNSNEDLTVILAIKSNEIIIITAIKENNTKRLKNDKK